MNAAFLLVELLLGHKLKPTSHCRKAPALKTRTMAAESCFAGKSCFVSIFLSN